MTANTNLNNDKKYEYFDVTADIGFYAYGDTLNKAYENAGLAMFDVITNINKVDKKISREIEIISEDLVSLLYDYLEELLFLQDTEFLFFSDFNVDIIKLNESSDDSNLNNYKLNCIAYGDEINWNIHDHGSEVKAITFHKMDIKKEDGFYKIQAILDL